MKRRTPETKKKDYKRNRRWRKEHKERYIYSQFKSRLKLEYNMTMEEFRAMETKQQGCCALCEREEFLVIDHNHETGKVRGLLCRACNLLVGVLEKFEDLLPKVGDYLDGR